MIKVGQREVGRTREIKFGEHIAWEKPNERFRLPLDDIKGDPLPDGTPMVAAATERTVDDEDKRNLQTQEMAAVPAMSDHFTHGGWDAGKDQRLSLENQAIGRPHSLTLTIEIWSKHAMGRREDFLGRASVPAFEIEHPPGDTWLPLENGLPLVQSFAECIPPDEMHAEHKKSGKLWESGLFKTMRKVLSKEPQPANETGGNLAPTSSVHIWLGKVRRGSASGREPGRGRVILRVHSAEGLGQVGYK